MWYKARFKNFVLTCKVGHFCKHLKFCKAFSHMGSIWSAPKAFGYAEHKILVPFCRRGNGDSRVQTLCPDSQNPGWNWDWNRHGSFLAYLARMDRKTQGQLSTSLGQSSSVPLILYRCKSPWNILPTPPPPLAALPPSTQMYRRLPQEKQKFLVHLLLFQPPYSMVPFSISKGPSQ